MNRLEQLRLLRDSGMRLVAMLKSQMEAIDDALELGCGSGAEAVLRDVKRDTDAQLAATEDQLKTAFRE